MKRQKAQNSFVLCVRNEGSEELEPRKVYQLLPDREADREGYLRVVDESGDDYLYPAEYFVSVRLPASVLEEFGSSSAPLGSAPRSGRSPKVQSRTIRGLVQSRNR